jgi:hypothetical protein
MRALLKVEREWEISHGNDQKEEENMRNKKEKAE